ncbi:MAG: NAD-glutamate dehydrogenase [Nitrospiraceae bacterium]|nr:NAD-glutamate dehydrogenase [Nitrospiraceae bacterium]
MSDSSASVAHGQSQPPPPKSLSDGLTAALAQGALPGEADGFADTARDEAGVFLARAALHRAPATVSIMLEPMAGEGTSRRMRLALINDDMPFLVDSASMIVAAEGLAVDRILHPVVTVRRDPDGLLTHVSLERESGERRESMIYLELERGDARARRLILRRPLPPGAPTATR